MEVAVTEAWQQVRTVLVNEGWQVGWAEYEDSDAESVWLVQAARADVVELADGVDLDDAFGKLYCLTH